MRWVCRNSMDSQIEVEMTAGKKSWIHTLRVRGILENFA